jgi:excisionase family DNA binding protein
VKKNKATEIPEIMTGRDVAEYLKLHPETVQRLAKRGDLSAFRLGSDWRFRRGDIQRWIEKRETIAAEIEPGPPRGRKGK